MPTEMLVKLRPVKKDGSRAAFTGLVDTDVVTVGFCHWKCVLKSLVGPNEL